MDYELETHYIIFSVGDGMKTVIKPDSDALAMVEVTSGDVVMVFDPDLAILVAEAMIKVAGDLQHAQS